MSKAFVLLGIRAAGLGLAMLVLACTAGPSAVERAPGSTEAATAPTLGGGTARSSLRPEDLPGVPKLTSLATPLKLTIPAVTIGAATSLLWAMKDGGFFDKYGLDVEITYIQSSSTAVQTLVSGDLKLIYSAAEAMTAANESGADLVMFTSSHNVPTQVLLATPDIRSMQDLRGKTVTVSRFGSSSDFVARYLLRAAGLSPGENVTVIQVGDARARLAALEQGTAQASSTSTEYAILGESMGYRIVGDPIKEGLEMPGTGLISSRAWLQRNEDAARRLARASVDAMHFMKTRRQDTKEIIKRWSKVDDESVLDRTYEVYVLGWFQEAPAPTLKAFQTLLESRAAAEPASAAVDPTTLFVDKYVKELETAGYIKALYGR